MITGLALTIIETALLVNGAPHPPVTITWY